MSTCVMSICVIFNLCDVNLCDVNLCYVKLCDVNLCDVNLCDVKLCDVSVRVCDVNLCGVCLCDVNLCNANLCAELPQTQFTHSKAPNPHARKTSKQNFRISYWHSYPEHNLHTARRQTPMAGTHQHKIFATPIGTATPNTIYTQQGAKPPWQEHINTKFSQLLLAQRPQTQFTHGKLPNPHARKTSTQNFSSFYWHSLPEHNLHTASCQTRMPGRHQNKFFAAPIGTVTPNTIYIPQGAKRAYQEDIKTKFSQLLLAQPPQTQFTYGKTQRQRRRPKTTPKRTSDPLEVPQVPRLPRKTQRQRRRPKTTPKRTLDRLEAPQAPRLPRKTQRQRRRPKTTPKRISDRLEAPQVPRLPRKMQRQRRRPKTTPKRTSDRLEVPQVPRGNSIGIVDLKQFLLL